MNPALRNIILAPQGIVKRGLVAWYDFTDPAGSQVLTDKSGYGNHGQNGSTAGADTNDVVFDGTKAVFGGDDYINSNVVVPAGGRTFVAILSSNDVASVCIYLGGATTYDRIGNSGKLLSSESFNSTQRILTNPTILANGVPYFAASRRDYGVYDNFIGLNKASYATPADIAYSPDESTIDFIGALTASNYRLNGNMYYLLIYNVILTDREIAKSYTVLKKLMAQKGIAI